MYFDIPTGTYYTHRIDEISLQDRIIQAYGINVPLLEFHPVKSFCADTGSDHMTEMEHDDDFDLAPDDSNIQIFDTDRDPYMITLKKDESVLSKHPYVIKRCDIISLYSLYTALTHELSRSFLRVVDFTESLNRQEYNKLHNNLRTTGVSIHLLVL